MAVTLKEVAQLAGTSPAAVSATLNGSRSKNIRVGEETRARIVVAADQLGYVSNPVARTLATGKSKVLGLMLPYVEAFADHNPFCAQVTNGVMAEVVRQQYNTMLYTGAAGSVDSRIDGLVLVMPEEDSPAFLKCESRKIPYVSILREPLEGTYTVNGDDFAGAHLATRHLITLGHRRIAHLMGQEGVLTTTPRREGYKHALIEAGLPFEEDMTLQSGFDWRGGYAAVKKILSWPKSQRPTAIFAANDLSAEGALRALREAGLSVPTDMAVVGYDDSWLCQMTQPPLTSVRMRIEEMGALAVQMLVKRLEGLEIENPHPVLPASLTIRASCGS